MASMMVIVFAVAVLVLSAGYILIRWRRTPEDPPSQSQPTR
jgi:hypothetical protein